MYTKSKDIEVVFRKSSRNPFSFRFEALEMQQPQILLRKTQSIFRDPPAVCAQVIHSEEPCGSAVYILHARYLGLKLRASSSPLTTAELIMCFLTLVFSKHANGRIFSSPSWPLKTVFILTHAHF